MQKWCEQSENLTNFWESRSIVQNQYFRDSSYKNNIPSAQCFHGPVSIALHLLKLTWAD